MRWHIRSSLIKSVGLLLLWSVVCGAQSLPRRVIDPLFLISYDPHKVQFDRMPPILNRRCAQLHNHYAVAWVYGHLKTPDAEYYVIDGNIETNVPEEGYGFTVEIRGSNCYVEPTPTVFFQVVGKKNASPPSLNISDETLGEISTELLHRYAKAFGGKRKFLRHVTRQHQEELPPILREKFEVFKRDP